jgi:TRAP-type C4-dicarboxylate transport system substrate-binding protein
MAISGHNIMIGKRTWARLPADIQKIMMEEGKKTQEAYLKWVTEFEAKAVENIKAQGGTVVPMSADELKKWRAASPDFLKVWEEATAKATGDAETPRKVAARWRQLLAQ